MLTLRKLRDLTLYTGSSPERPAHLSAASGLVCVNEHLYVVADDELHLGVFSVRNHQAGELLRLFPGELPLPYKQRKKHKPDLEILLHLPASAAHAQGALLALGSGSKERRYRGALLPLDAAGRTQQSPIEVDAMPLLASLTDRIGKLNLEGAWLHGTHLHLLQRGNKGGPNAVITLPWPVLHKALITHAELPAAHAQVHEMNLGSVDSIPLCFSDAVAMPDGRWLFSAVAEDTDNAVDDGAFVGAALGIADAHFTVQRLEQLTPAVKVEGIDILPHGKHHRVLMVTDADDVQQPAGLFTTDIAW